MKSVHNCLEYGDSVSFTLLLIRWAALHPLRCSWWPSVLRAEYEAEKSCYSAPIPKTPLSLSINNPPAASRIAGGQPRNSG